MISTAVHSLQILYVQIQRANREEALVEIYKVMRPGEPPTEEAAQNFIQ